MILFLVMKLSGFHICEVASKKKKQNSGIQLIRKELRITIDNLEKSNAMPNNMCIVL